MGGVVDERECPVCGMVYTYEFDTRTFEEYKLSSCLCDLKTDLYSRFIKEKGLEKEFEEFRKREEREFWKDWLRERAESETIEGLIDLLKGHAKKITEHLSDEEIIAEVMEGIGFAGYSDEDVVKLIKGLAEVLEKEEGCVKRLILAEIL